MLVITQRRQVNKSLAIRCEQWQERLETSKRTELSKVKDAIGDKMDKMRVRLKRRMEDFIQRMFKGNNKMG
jgi:hypothetical protein